MDTARNDALEAAMFAAPTDPAAALVYADWLEDRGLPIVAAGYRLLGGQVATPPVDAERWAGILAVVGAAWQVDVAARPVAWKDTTLDDYRTVEEFVAEAYRARTAVLTGGGKPRQSRDLDPVDAPGVTSQRWAAVREAAARLHDYGLGGSAEDLIAAARGAAVASEATTLHELLRMTLSTAQATGRSPFEANPALSDAIAKGFTERDVRPTMPDEDEGGSISFGRVLVTHATRGVYTSWLPRSAELSSLAVLCQCAARDDLEPDAYNEMTVEERLEFLVDEVFPEGLEWAPLTHFEALEWFVEWMAQNEGAHATVDGEPGSVFQKLESFGPFIAGAHTPNDDFPFTFLEFERAWVFCHITY